MQQWFSLCIVVKHTSLSTMYKWKTLSWKRNNELSLCCHVACHCQQYELPPRHFCWILKACNVKFPSSPNGINRSDTCGRRDGEIWRIQRTPFATCTISSENLHYPVLGLIQSGLFSFHGFCSVNFSVVRPTFLQPAGMYLYTESGIRLWFIRNK
jgi:hypothetical protein